MNYIFSVLVAFMGGATLTFMLCGWRLSYLRRIDAERFVNRWRRRLKEAEDVLVKTEEAQGATT